MFGVTEQRIGSRFSAHVSCVLTTESQVHMRDAFWGVLCSAWARVRTREYVSGGRLSGCLLL